MEVTIYRGSPSSDLNTGDWVALSREYAEFYADGTNSEVYEFKVKASELSWDGDDFREFGYWGKSKKAKK